MGHCGVAHMSGLSSSNRLIVTITNLQRLGLLALGVKRAACVHVTHDRSMLGCSH